MMDLDTTMKLIEATEFGNKAGKFLDWGKECINKVAGYSLYRTGHSRGKTSLGAKEKTKNKRNCWFCVKKKHGIPKTLR